MKSNPQAAVFGKRREPHTVIIARGDDIRHFTVRPWLATLGVTAFSVAAIGYFAATSYLVFRDDLIGASVARQARLQQDYEDRISALRGQVDRISSRQMLDQQLVEGKVAKLMQQQALLSDRNERLQPLLAKEAPVPAKEASAIPLPNDPAAPVQAASAGNTSLAALRLDTAVPGQSRADRADIAFVAVNRSLRDLEATQMARLDTLADRAFRTADGITSVLADAGLVAPGKAGGDAMGGPYIPVTGGGAFDAKARELDAALERLKSAKAKAGTLPLAAPAGDRPISSTFGVRADPLLGTPAMHSGIDFRAPAGLPARATAPGTVVKAGWAGGYGQMVEIAHGDGLSTRFGHLSRIDVTEGEKVRTGEVIGEVGSTGRSTGPHLHYEVREDGEAVDPMRFLQAGRRISRFMQGG